MTSPHESPVPLGPPRFSLRTLLLVVTLFGIFLGLFWWLPPLIMLGVVLGTLAIGAHVAGNAVGTRLRDGPATHPRQVIERPAANPLAPHVPATSLGDRSSLGWGLILATAAGVVIGIVAGCIWIQYAYRIGFDPYGLAIAGFAFGMLGGFVAFALASFSQVLAIAILQAMRHK